MIYVDAYALYIEFYITYLEIQQLERETSLHKYLLTWFMYRIHANEGRGF